MKRLKLVTTAIVLLCCLTACQGGKKTNADKYWAAAQKEKGIESYVAANRDKMDLEALKAEAASADLTPGQQFKAVSLLCQLEYQSQLDSQEAEAAKSDREGNYQFDYPISSSFADAYLAKVNTDTENFWTSMSEAFSPYDCFTPIFAAAQNLDGQTVTGLINGIPEDSKYGDAFKKAIDLWIKEKPEKLTAYGETLREHGYYKDWKKEDWKSHYFKPSSTRPGIRVKTADEALAYTSYLANTLLPALETEFDKESFQTTSQWNETPFYSTGLSVIIEDELALQEPQGDLPEIIELEGKKVAAFYRNPQSEEFTGSPAPLRLLGDFMFMLPKEVFPQTISEADYYLVLTADYQYGEYYKSQGGSETKVQDAYSNTSVDLYEGGTGAFLRHLGNIAELAPSQIYADLTKEATQYPEDTTSEILYYIYQNINTPEAYVTFMMNTDGFHMVGTKDVPVLVGNWEITYHSSQTLKTFDEGMYRYEANDGTQFVRARFTITNRGFQSETLLPMVVSFSSDARNELFVQVTDDQEEENLYSNLNVLDLRTCLNTESFDPGETMEGELLFEVPDDVIKSGTPLFIEFVYNMQKLLYPVGS